jgi:hypothetical protein
VCHGFFIGLWFMSAELSARSRFCPPAGANADQALRIVVKQIEDDPTLLNEDIRQLAVVHLQRVWPCR